MGRVGNFSGGGLGFGVAFRLEDEFSNVATQIENNFQHLGGAVDRTAQWIDSSMTKMRVGAAALAIGVAGLMPFFRGSQIQAEFEAAEVGLTTLLKSREEAIKTIAEIKQTALTLPSFEFQSLLQANQLLISTGVSAEKSQRIINSLTNALSAVGRGNEELMRMGINLQQIAANGEATAVDIKQFAFAGINLRGLIDDMLGFNSKAADTKITIDLIAAALERASGKGGMFEGGLERMSKTVKGLTAAMQENISFTFGKMGEAIEPITKQILIWINAILTKIQSFADSPLGKFVFRLIFALSVFLTVGGLALILIGALRMAAYYMALSFGGAAKAAIVQTLATQGLTAGMRQLAAATWAALAPLLPYIAAIAAVGAGIYLLWRLLNSDIPFFVKMKERLTKFFDQLKGYVALIREVWASWDSLTQTFTISEQLEARLKKLGIWENALAIATWVVRIKEFFVGVWEGFKLAASVIKEAITWFTNELEPAIIKALDSIGIHIGKNTTQLDKWKQVGKIVGIAIVASLALIAMALVAVGLAAIVALAIPIAMMWLMYTVINYVIEKFRELWDFFGRLGELGGQFWDAGANMIRNLWEGMKSVFNDMANWFIDKMSYLSPSFLASKLAMEFVGSDHGPASGSFPNELGSLGMQASRMKASSQFPMFMQRDVTQPKQPIILHNNIHLDGDPIKKSIKEWNDLDNSRSE